MRILPYSTLALALALSACQPASTPSTTQPAIDSVVTPAPAARTAPAEPALITQGKEILRLAATADFAGFQGHIHPVEGVIFSPYTNVDEGTDRLFSPAEFQAQYEKEAKERLNWGISAGEGAPIRLTLADYFKQYVADKDYLAQGRFSLDSTMGKSTIINNIAEFYPGTHVFEAYHPGSDPKFDGMDWSSVRLVFKDHEGVAKLVGVVHDAWAP